MNISFRIVNICRPYFKLSRRFSVCTYSMKSWNPVLDARHFELGRSMLEVLAIEVMMKDFKLIPAHHMNDIAIGITNSSVINTEELPSEKVIENEEDLSILLGYLQLKNKKEVILSLSEAVKNDIHRALSLPDTVRSLIISQHPKALLDFFSNQNKDNLRLVSYSTPNEEFEAKVYFNDEMMFKALNMRQEEAERIVCLQLLYSHYENDLKTIDINNFNFPLEEEIKLGLGPRKKRTIEMKKASEEAFGFTIRGGEQKVVRSKEFIQYHTITPIFISKIDEGSAAERCDLQVGDIILSVNDYSLKHQTHREAVTTLKKFADSESVSFTVTYDKHVLLKNEAEKDLLSRQQSKISKEMANPKFQKWHQAKAKSNPEQYIVGKIENKKRDFHPKNSRKAIRLWDFKDFKK